MKTLYNKTLCLAFIFTSTILSAQNLKPVAATVAEKKQRQADFLNTRLFDVANATSQSTPQLENIVTGALVLDFNKNVANVLLSRQPENISFIIPSQTGQNVELEMYRSNIFTSDFSVVTAANNSAPVHYTNGLHYWGIIKGNNSSIAAISIFDNEVMGMISSNDGNFVLGKLHDDKDGRHIYYNDKNLKAQNYTECFTQSDNETYSGDQLQNPAGKMVQNCIRLYWEVNYDIFLDKGSVANAANYVTGLFNQSAIIYTNDNIPVMLSQVYVWDVASPYTSTSTSGLLNQFQAFRNSFNGDLGHLLGYEGGGGVAAGFNGLCNINLDNSQCYSGIHSTYANFPTYSWNVEVVTHEQGHLMGSRHTHACVWNGNNTAIDGCGPSAGYGYEGNCSGAPIPSSGTIMSYCHLVSAGINFNNGFGTQPANVILSNYGAASCLVNCSGIACFYPNNLTTTNITTTTATLNWDTVAGAVSYNIQYRIVGTPAWTTASSPVNSYNAIGLTPGSLYEWQVQTVCTGGNSVYTFSANFITVPLSCNAPSGLSTTAISSSSATFNWNAVGGAVSYTIEYRETGTIPWSSGVSLVNSYYAIGLTPNTSYQWHVQTVCSGGGISPNSIDTSFTTTLSPTPAACYPFSGNANDVTGNGHDGTVNGATLTYNRFGVANSAYLFDGIDDFISVPAFNTILLSDEVSFSFWAISYYFKSQAAIIMLPDDINDRFCISINYWHNGVPATFWDYGSIFSNGRQNILPDPYVAQWNHYVFISSASQNKMEIYRNGMRVAFDQHHDDVLNKNKILNIGGGMAYPGNSNFFFSGAIDDVVIYNTILDSSEIAYLYQQNTPCIILSGIDEHQAENTLNIYPNPSSGNLLIEYNLVHDADFEILDVLGQIVYSKTLHKGRESKINVRSLAKGMYIVRVTGEDGIKTGRVIIE